jgi:hypothetical protein
LWEKTDEHYHKLTISENEMLQAVSCMIYFEQAAEKVYQEIGVGCTKVTPKNRA